MNFVAQTLNNQSGGVLTNYPIRFKTPAAPGVIPDEGTVFVNGIQVSAVVRKYQARGDGSASVLQVAAVIPSLAPGVPLAVEIRNSLTNSNGTGLTKAQMLATDFDCRFLYNGSQLVSLRALVAADKYVVVYAGAAATRILVADWALGGLGDPAGVGPAGLKPVTAFGYITFWSTGQIEYEPVSEHANSEVSIISGVTYSLQISIGNTAPTVVFNQAGLFQPAGSMFAFPSYWQGGQPNQQVDRKLNINLCANAGVIDPFAEALALDQPAIDAAYASIPATYSPTDLWICPAGLTNGGDNAAMQYPVTHARAVYGHWKSVAAMTRFTQTFGSFPATFRERRVGKANLGKAVSSQTRPSQCFLGTIGGCNDALTYIGIAPADRFTMYDNAGGVYFSSSVNAPSWGQGTGNSAGRSWDAAHLPVPFALPSYLLDSGYADQASAGWAAWAEMNRYPGGNRGPTDDAGIVYGDGGFGFARHTARSLRTVFHASLTQPDGDFWLARSRADLAANADFWAGKQGLPFHVGTPNYNWGIARRDEVNAGAAPTAGQNNPLHSWYWGPGSGGLSFWGGDPTSFSSCALSDFWSVSPGMQTGNVRVAGGFNEAYLDIVLANIKRSLLFSSVPQLTGWDVLAADHAKFYDDYLATTEGTPAENLRLKKQVFLHMFPWSDPATGAYLTTRLPSLANWNPSFIAGTGPDKCTNLDLALAQTLGLIGSDGYVANGAGVVTRAAIMANGSAASQTFAAQWDAQRDANVTANFRTNPKAAFAPHTPAIPASPAITPNGTTTVTGTAPANGLVRLYLAGTNTIAADNIVVDGSGNWSAALPLLGGAQVEAVTVSAYLSSRSAAYLIPATTCVGPNLTSTGTLVYVGSIGTAGVSDTPTVASTPAATWTKVSGPSWVSVNSATGQLAWTAGAVAGTHIIQRKVANGCGIDVTQTVTLLIPPAVDLLVQQAGNAPITLGAVTTQASGTPTYSMLSGPGWFNWTGTQGTGTPPAGPGIYTGTIEGCSSSASCTVAGPLCSTKTFAIVIT